MKTTDNRQPDYGDFSDRSEIADTLIQVMENCPRWKVLPPWARQSLREIAGKISRLLNGDHMKADSWHDIQGYAYLAERECK